MEAGSGWYYVRVVSWEDLSSKLAEANYSSVLSAPLHWSHCNTRCWPIAGGFPSNASDSNSAYSLPKVPAASFLWQSLVFTQYSIFLKRKERNWVRVNSSWPGHNLDRCWEIQIDLIFRGASLSWNHLSINICRSTIDWIWCFAAGSLSHSTGSSGFQAKSFTTNTGEFPFLSRVLRDSEDSWALPSHSFCICSFTKTRLNTFGKHLHRY